MFFRLDLSDFCVPLNQIYIQYAVMQLEWERLDRNSRNFCFVADVSQR